MPSGKNEFQVQEILNRVFDPTNNRLVVLARLVNNEYLVGRNAADGADVEIIKVNASDLIEFGGVGFAGASFLDEDAMNSDSATKLASQQSIRAYVDKMVGVPLNAGWTGVVVNSGAVAQAPRLLRVDTGATSSSTAAAKAFDCSWSAGKARAVINWGKRVIIRLVISNDQNTTNGIIRFTLGKSGGIGVAALTDKGIGIQIDNLALKGIVHNGSSGATIDLTLTMVDDRVYVIVIVSDGSGNIEWFVDGTSEGTSAAGPIGDSGSARNILQLEADNGSDSADQAAGISDLKVYVEQ